MLRNPFAPGKDHAYSRYGSITSIRTSNWRMINTGGDYDLYDLSAFRYELEDVSAAHPAVVADLSADLTTQATRPGTTYLAWAGGNPLLADPDADADDDGRSNLLEYAAGSDPLDAASHPYQSLAIEDLSSTGHGNDEFVFSFNLATDADDFSLLPSTSTDLLNWSFDPLEFLGATDLGSSLHQLRYRLTDSSAASRFFRLQSSSPP
jgi:hypothetical protein